MRFHMYLFLIIIATLDATCYFSDNAIAASTKVLVRVLEKESEEVVVEVVPIGYGWCGYGLAHLG